MNPLIRTIEQKKRKCGGKRTEGAFYLVTEPGNGELPLIVEVDPPVVLNPPDGHPLTRTPIVVDLDLLLAGEDYETFISGSSASRLRRQRLQEPEIAAFGMPLERRRSSGICATDGLEAIRNVSPRSIPIAGLYFRHFVGMAKDKTVAEVVTAFSQHNWPALLAALHRGWRVYPPKKRELMRQPIGMLMDAIGASADKELLT